MVTSKSDHQDHYIGARKLAWLYGVLLDECEVLDTDRPLPPSLRELARTMIRLVPRYDGDYRLPTRTDKEKTMSINDQVLAEVARATAKFPTWPTDPLHALAVLGEEVGELTKAMLQYTYEPHKGVTQQDIRDEAIQTAAMALRLAMSLPCYQYRRAPQHSQGRDNLPADYEV